MAPALLSPSRKLTDLEVGATARMLDAAVDTELRTLLRALGLTDNSPLRVCKRGGKIGLANWTPGGFIGQVFKTVGKYVPPPHGTRSPALWGTEARIAELFQAQASAIKLQQRHFVFRYRSARHWLDIFRTYYGPVLKTFAALEPAAQTAIEQDLINLVEQFNRSGNSSMVVPSEYLEVVVTRL